MAGLSPAGQDRLLFIGLGLATCAVIGLMRQMLVHYRDTAIIPQEQSKPQYITQEVEDSLKLSTLDKLLDSANYCVRETTSVIIGERALHDGPTMDALLYYITRPEYSEREKGIRALTLMLSFNDSTSLATIKALNKPEGYAALVKSLEYCSREYDHNPLDPEWDNWYLRDIVEQGSLFLLGMLTKEFGTEGLIKSRFVERWLAKEPFGDSTTERATTFASILEKHQRLNDILLPLFRDRVGRRQLIAANLVPAEMEKHFLRQESDVRMVNGEGTAGEDFDGMFVESRRRPDQNSEEEHMRRRHREAMVLNDGGPLRRGDIIQREES